MTITKQLWKCHDYHLSITYGVTNTNTLFLLCFHEKVTEVTAVSTFWGKRQRQT